MRFMAAALDLHANLWLEQNNEVVLSSWRVQLLEAIEATGSISAAAERMHVQYHRAWDRLDEMERGLGVQLVDRQVGGPGGGGARLTEAGRSYVARFNRFSQSIESIIRQQFRRTFGGE